MSIEQQLNALAQRVSRIEEFVPKHVVGEMPGDLDGIEWVILGGAIVALTLWCGLSGLQWAFPHWECWKPKPKVQIDWAPLSSNPNIASPPMPSTE